MRKTKERQTDDAKVGGERDDRRMTTISYEKTTINVYQQVKLKGKPGVASQPDKTQT